MEAAPAAITPSLNPAQLRVLAGLMGAGEERPAFDPMLPARLMDLLEAGLAEPAGRLGVGELVIHKHLLNQVHQCEQLTIAEQQEGFAWSPRTASGTVAHKAIELAVFSTDDPSPLELVDRALARIADAGDPWGPADFLARADEAERAELRAEANDRVAKFLDCFPPIKKQWRPVLESRARVDLLERRVVLKSKVDLALGRRDGDRARVLIVDFKSRAPHRTHIDDLRFYALLDTIRSGVPPFRVASYYLDAARWQHEDIDEDVLFAAAHRVVDGAHKLIELLVDKREPTTTPGPSCSFCPQRDDCDGARQWAERDLELV
jgi:hypothetical protein